MTIIPLTLKISIYRETDAPGYEKDFVYGINEIDKGIRGGKWIGYLKDLPQLVKALVCFILTLKNQL